MRCKFAPEAPDGHALVLHLTAPLGCLAFNAGGGVTHPDRGLNVVAVLPAGATDAPGQNFAEAEEDFLFQCCGVRRFHHLEGGINERWVVGHGCIVRRAIAGNGGRSGSVYLCPT